MDAPDAQKPSGKRNVDEWEDAESVELDEAEDKDLVFLDEEDVAEARRGQQHLEVGVELAQAELESCEIRGVNVRRPRPAMASRTLFCD